MAHERELADHLATIRADLRALTGTVSQLASDTIGIKDTVARSAGKAARSAADTGQWFLQRAERWGGDAAHAAERGALAAINEVQEEIERNPLTAVLFAVGFGIVVGFLG